MDTKLIKGSLGLVVMLLVLLACNSEPKPILIPFGNECEPAYWYVCIAPPPPDLDCDDIPHRGFVVLAPDPHGFDPDQDGIGCENGEDETKN